MSKALAFLARARPEAMQAYFAFLKKAGGRLDPKTRNLISVITKVHAQTAGGFRQYLRRALAQGASADEVLDALLMAFPALGLTRVLWAVDIMLEDGAIGADDAAPGEGAWHDLGALEEVPEGAARRIDRDGRGFLVRRADGEVRVYDARCPHRGTDIPGDALEGDMACCPGHGWRFDLARGGCAEEGDAPLACIEHRLRDGRIEARW